MEESWGNSAVTTSCTKVAHWHQGLYGKIPFENRQIVPRGKGVRSSGDRGGGLEGGGPHLRAASHNPPVRLPARFSTSVVRENSHKQVNQQQSCRHTSQQVGLNIALSTSNFTLFNFNI